MTYHDALTEARRVGASTVDGLPHLAQVISSLASIHAINPRLVFEGAVKLKLTAAQVLNLDPVELGDLMFA